MTGVHLKTKICTIKEVDTNDDIYQKQMKYKDNQIKYHIMLDENVQEFNTPERSLPLCPALQQAYHFVSSLPPASFRDILD